MSITFRNWREKPSASLKPNENILCQWPWGFYSHHTSKENEIHFSFGARTPRQADMDDKERKTSSIYLENDSRESKAKIIRVPEITSFCWVVRTIAVKYLRNASMPFRNSFIIVRQMPHICVVHKIFLQLILQTLCLQTKSTDLTQQLKY